MSRVIEKTVFEFHELSNRAKQSARQDYVDRGMVVDYGWHEYMFDDFVKCAACLGVEINFDSRHTIGNKTIQHPCIYFSGFCSQGDGASFAGSYHPKIDAIEAVLAYAPRDTELQTFAEQLTALQMRVQLKHDKKVEAYITCSGHYSHSNSMNVDVSVVGGNESDHAFEREEHELANIMRSFADWMYAKLEAEHDYQHSDEAIDEQLADHEFDEDGAIV